MPSLVVGICHVTMFLRFSRSLKDKRQILLSLKQKLRNEGFSVAELGYTDSPKSGSLGFTYVGSDAAYVDRVLDEALRLFVGNCEVVNVERDVFDYAELKDRKIKWPDPE